MNPTCSSFPWADTSKVSSLAPELCKHRGVLCANMQGMATRRERGPRHTSAHRRTEGTELEQAPLAAPGALRMVGGGGGGQGAGRGPGLLRRRARAQACPGWQGWGAKAKGCSGWGGQCTRPSGAQDHQVAAEATHCTCSISVCSAAFRRTSQLSLFGKTFADLLFLAASSSYFNVL